MELLWRFIQPSNSLLILTLIGLLMLWTGWRRTAAWCLWTAGIAFAALLFLPISGSLMVALETRFPQPDLPDKIAGIIVLGGAVDPRGTERWDQPQLTARVERLTEGATLARRYPEAKLVYTGGSWRTSDKYSESDVARQFFLQLGLSEDQMIFENQSTSTFENAAFTLETLQPQPGEVWVLVTSAYHMPRSVGIFRKAGWEIVPYPVDYYTKGEVQFLAIPNVGSTFSAVDFATREWVAMGGYYFKGWSDTFFPGPDDLPVNVSDSDQENE
ncbi:MAG: YdcF family protein [Proteobacteria bacterium]|nr:YdcF family protein [Pseudomonadota bacterium]